MIRIFQGSEKPGTNGPFFTILLLIAVFVMLPGTGCKSKQEKVAPQVVKKKVQPVVKSPAKPAVEPAAQPAVSDASGTPETPPVDEGEASDQESADLVPMDEADKEELLAEAEEAVKKPRDPFRSFVKIHAGDGKNRRVQNKILTPLQKYSLDQLRVVGVIDGPNLNKALLEDDAGKGYVVGQGDLIGNQGGRIAFIKPDRIIIEETVIDVMGREQIKRITKKLYTPEQESQR